LPAADFARRALNLESLAFVNYAVLRQNARAPANYKIHFKTGKPLSVCRIFRPAG